MPPTTNRRRSFCDIGRLRGVETLAKNNDEDSSTSPQDPIDEAAKDDPKFVRKEHTCHYWWLRAGIHSEENCEYAHRLWDGRTRKHAGLHIKCGRQADGKCFWPARLCYWDHGVASTSHLLDGGDADRLNVTDGVLCKHCDAWFANDVDMTRHLDEKDEKYDFPCQVLKKLRQVSDNGLGGHGHTYST